MTTTIATIKFTNVQQQQQQQQQALIDQQSHTAKERAELQVL